MQDDAKVYLVDEWADAEAWFVVIDGGDEWYTLNVSMLNKVEPHGVD